MVDLLPGAGSLVAYEIARVVSSAYVRARGIREFPIADTLGNWLGTLAAMFLIIGLLGRDMQHQRSLLMITGVSMLVFELAHCSESRAIRRTSSQRSSPRC